ncbi:ATP-binding cassette domain-containing protein, partial [Rhizobiaceae sp. 2RAB30]
MTKTFNAGVVAARPALNGLDLVLARGDFVVVIGSNGAGKSTLLNMIAGAIEPDTGTLTLADRD